MSYHSLLLGTYYSGRHLCPHVTVKFLFFICTVSTERKTLDMDALCIEHPTSGEPLRREANIPTP